MKKRNLNPIFSIKKISQKVLLSVSLTLFCHSVNSQDILIKNATVHTATDKGVLKKTDIYISDGFIMEVAQNIKLSSIKTFDSDSF